MTNLSAKVSCTMIMETSCLKENLNKESQLWKSQEFSTMKMETRNMMESSVRASGMGKERGTTRIQPLGSRENLRTVLNI